MTWIRIILVGASIGLAVAVAFAVAVVLMLQAILDGVQWRL